MADMGILRILDNGTSETSEHLSALLKEQANPGIRLPEIGFGTWNYREGVEPLRAAIECGARLIDTAESYGTEVIVGEAIKGRRHQGASPKFQTARLDCGSRKKPPAAGHRSYRSLPTPLAQPRHSHRRADAGDGGSRRCRQSAVHRSQQFLRARPGERPSGPFQTTNCGQSGTLQPN